MKFASSTVSLIDSKTGCLVSSLKSAAKVAQSNGQRAAFRAATRDFEDKAGSLLTVNLDTGCAVQRLLIVGGTDEKLSRGKFRKAARQAAEALCKVKTTNALWALNQASVEKADAGWKAATSLSAVANASYTFTEHKSSGNGKTPHLARLTIHADDRSRASIARAVKQTTALKAGLDWARDLGNQPPNVCNPAYLQRESRALSRQPKVSVSVLEEKKMTELGMGAFMAVSQGSDAPGKMIIINYQGARKKTAAPIVLIGKGITFDSGGISIKPSAAMDEMKYDMCGAASVLGATKAAITAGLPINLITIVAAAENMPSGRATRPGDIVETLSGKTVEILNTDAEGRLVLCDALTYAERYKPKAVIDVATLTGACIVALGSHASAVYANDDELSAALVDAGEESGDRAWPMPLWDEYQESLSSRFADIPNIGSGGAGSITAACFLSRFADKFTWAHMDVAGSAFQGGAKKGATGRPVGLLFQYLLDQAAA
jgi:leucyl aminopeptidase